MKRLAKTLASVGVLSFAVLSAGCGGGGGGSNGSKLPNIPSLPAIAPSTPSEAFTEIIDDTNLPVTGISSTTTDSNITSSEIPGVVALFSNPDEVIFPIITSADGKEGYFATATQLGIGSEELARFFSTTYPLQSIIQPGDQLLTITVNLANGSTLTTPAIVTPTGALRFASPLNFIPGASAYPGTLTEQTVQSKDKNRTLSLVTNRNPFTGEILFQVSQLLTLSRKGQTVRRFVSYPIQTVSPGVSITDRSEPVFTETTIGSGSFGRTVQVTSKVDFTYAIRVGDADLTATALKKASKVSPQGANTAVNTVTSTATGQITIPPSQTGGG